MSDQTRFEYFSVFINGFLVTSGLKHNMWKYPPVSVENFLLWTPLVSRSPPTWSLSIWFWSIAIQAFHWLRQILLCQSSRLGQLKITHSFEVNLNIFIKNKFFNCFFPENNHIWRKVKEKGSSPKLISPFLDPICRLRSLQPSKNKFPWAFYECDRCRNKIGNDVDD